MDEAVKQLSGIIRLVIFGPTPALEKIVLILGLFILFILFTLVTSFIIAFASQEAKRFSTWIHNR